MQKGENTVIVVTGYIRIAPEKLDAARPQAKKNLEATRNEKGCLLYAYGEDVLDPGLIRITERWESWEALAEHGNSPHMAVWRKALKEIGILERDLIAHETGEERAL